MPRTTSRCKIIHRHTIYKNAPSGALYKKRVPVWSSHSYLRSLEYAKLPRQNGYELGVRDAYMFLSSQSPGRTPVERLGSCLCQIE